MIFFRKIITVKKRKMPGSPVLSENSSLSRTQDGEIPAGKRRGPRSEHRESVPALLSSHFRIWNPLKEASPREPSGRGFGESGLYRCRYPPGRAPALPWSAGYGIPAPPCRFLALLQQQRAFAGLRDGSCFREPDHRLHSCDAPVSRSGFRDGLVPPGRQNSQSGLNPQRNPAFQGRLL